MTVGSLRTGVKPGSRSLEEVSAGLVWGWDGEMLELGLGAGTPLRD